LRPWLLTPGPVELHPRARLVLAGPQRHHRGEAAARVFSRVREGLKAAFGTAGETLLLTGSGTAGMEALVGGLFRPGERVVVPVSGKFSERWAEIALARGLAVERLELEWGTVLDPEAVAAHVDGGVAGVFLTHSETSTGVLNPIAEIAARVRAQNPEALVVVDAVTSLFVAPFALDEMGLDAAVAGSQKGLMLPPGLAFLALGPRALKRLQPYGYYLDLARELKTQPRGQAAFTPAINLIEAANAVLEVLLPELAAHQAEKAALNARLYTLGEAYGLRPVPPEGFESPATAAFWLPEGMDAEAVKAAFLNEGLLIAGGQGRLKGKIFRISLMGYFEPEQLEEVFARVERAFGAITGRF